jgi:hypothetical protein
MEREKGGLDVELEEENVVVFDELRVIRIVKLMFSRAAARYPCCCSHEDRNCPEAGIES